MGVSGMGKPSPVPFQEPEKEVTPPPLSPKRPKLEKRGTCKLLSEYICSLQDDYQRKCL